MANHRRSKRRRAQLIRRPLTRNRRLKLELLEDRLLLAGTATFVEMAQSLGPTSAESVALGDLDSDGDLDAVSVRSGFGRVWKNDGSATFSAGWSGALVGSQSPRIRLADLDGDGDLDLFAANSGADTVWFNDGQGSFTDSGQRLGSASSTGLELGDLDGDGDLDALVGYSSGASRKWLNSGSGSFSSGGSFSDSVAQGIALGDLDLDGDLDAVLTYASSQSRTWLNNGSAVFTGSQFFDVIGSSDVVLGDLDDDGDLDAYFGRSRAAPNEYWANTGAGSFVAVGGATIQSDSRVALADLDGDADLDVFRSAPGEHVLRNDGTGHLTPRGQSLPASLRSFALGDLDGDGDIDAFVSSSSRTGVWLNTDAELSIAIVNIPPTASTPLGATVDYEVTVTNTAGMDVTDATVFGEFLGGWSSVELTSIVATGSAASSLTLGPLSALADTVDLPVGASIVYSLSAVSAAAGDADLALEAYVGVSASISPPLGVLALQNGTRAIRQQVVTLGEASAGNTLYDSGRRLALGNTRDIALGDLDGDGDLDAFITQGRVDNQVWLGDGAGHFTDTGQRLSSQPPTPYGDRWSGQVVLGDVDGDGDLDAVVNTRYRLRLWLNNGAAVFTESAARFDADGGGIDDGGTEVVLGDVDNDGDLDIVSVDYSRTGRLWRNNGVGGFNQFTAVSVTRAESLVLADIDGDGDLDVVHNEGALFNDSTGVFTYQGRVGFDGDSVAVGDLDGDGDLDAVAGYADRASRVWTNNGDGKFTNTSQSLGDSALRTSAFTLLDVDADGDLDAYQVNSAAADILWLNDGRGVFSNSGRQFVAAAGVGATAGDVDSDGDLDLLVATSAGFDYLLLNLTPSELADLKVAKSAGPTSIAQGETFEYTITVSNLAATDVVGASFTELLPDTLVDAQLLSVETTGGATTNAAPGPFAGRLDAIANLPAGSTISYRIEARVPNAGSPATNAQQTITTTTRVSIPDGIFDSNLTDNVAQKSLVVMQAATDGTASFKNVFSVPNSFNPSGLLIEDAVLGDLDGDGDLDAVFAKVGNDAVWLSNGDGTFQVNAQVFNAGDRSHGVALGDLDGDGDLDAVFANRDEASQVWLNNGSGLLISFGPRLGGDDDVQGVALGDVDGDGDLDAFLISTRSDQSRPWINDGSGRLSDSGQLPLADATEITLGDLDGDGDLDAVAGRFLLVNNGSGSFQAHTPGFAGTSYQGGQLLGDVDGDGDLDLVIVRNGPNEVWLNDGAATFANSGQALGNYNTRDASLGDFDGDGDLDVLEAVTGGTVQANRIWLNNGAGVFSVAPAPFGDDDTAVVVVGDLDGDGRLDVLEINNGSQKRDRVWLNAAIDLGVQVVDVPQASSITEGSPVRYTVTVRNNGPVASSGAQARLQFDAGLTQIELLSVTPSPGASSTLVAGPLPHNLVDLVDLPAGGQIVYEIAAVVRGPQQPHAAPVSSVGLVASVAPPAGVLDGDPRNDRATDRNVIIQQAVGGSGVFEVGAQIFPSEVSRDVALGDLDGDGDLDAFVANRQGGNRIWLNDGQGQFVAGQVFTAAQSATYAVALGDMDGDGDLDAVAANIGANRSRVWINNGHGTFTSPFGPFGPVESFNDVALGDVDGDGDLDVMMAAYRVGRVLWINQGNGSLVQSDQEIGYVGVSVAFGDLDNDGDLDVARGRDVFLNDGRGKFTLTNQDLVYNGELALADLDGDNDLDLFFAIFRDSNRVLFNDGSGHFVDSGQVLGGTRDSTSVALADIDDDGDIDAVVTNYLQSDEVWLNDGTGHFTDSGQAIANSDSQAVALGDLDGDGDLDAFFANGGLTTTIGEPSRVWFNQSSLNFTDLSIEKSSSQVAVLQGATLTYRLIVTNHGPNAVAGATVTDWFAAGLQNVTLTSVVASPGASAGASPGALGGKHFADLVDLPVNGSVIYTFEAMVVPGGPHQASESVTANTASVTPPAGVEELTPANNRVADSDIVVLAPTRGNGRFGETDQVLGTGAATDVAMGDLDGDGDLDAVVVGEPNVSHRIWWNDGEGRFEDLGHELLNRQGEGVALGDLDRDGDLDIFVGANSSFMTWRNNGAGTFELWQDGNGGVGFVDMALADLNGDGYLDVLLSGGEQTIWFNDGTGQLLLGAQTLPRDLYRLAVGDVDSDGDLDAFFLFNSWELWLNDGLGTFTRDSFLMRDGSTVRSGSFARFGDLDNDNDLDLFVVASDFVGGGVYLNDGNGNFMAGDSVNGSDSGEVRLGDFDNDGDLDALVVEDEGQPDFLWLNDGSANFTRSDQFLGTTSTMGVAIGDLDNDGDLDFFTANGGGQRNRVWLNLDSAAPFDLSVRKTANRTSVHPGETLTYTIVVSNSGPKGVSGATVADALAGPFASAELTQVTVAGGASSSLVAGAITDAFEDMVDVPVGGSITYVVTVTAAQPLSPNQSPFAILSNGVSVSDRLGIITDIDPLSNHATDADVLVVEGSHGTGFFAEADYNLGTGNAAHIMLGDLDDDGDLDAFVIHEHQPSHVWLNDGTRLIDMGPLQTPDVPNESLSGQSGALGDLDGDGDLDAIVGNFRRQNHVWLNDGTGHFVRSTQPVAAFDTRGIALGDLDGDGDLDIFEATDTVSEIVWFNRGDATFYQSGQQFNFSDSRDVSLGDVDRDGDLDAFVTTTSGAVLWRNDGSGSFQNSGQQFSGLSGAAALGDLDNDGDLDVVSGNKLFINSGTGVFVASGQTLGNVSGSTVVVGDLDGDGDLDAFIGLENGASQFWINNGLAQFTPKIQEITSPGIRHAALGDLDGDGDLDLVTANGLQPSRVFRHLEASEVVDLSVAKTTDPDVFRGGSVNYRIEFRNDGPGDTSAHFRDFYDPRLSNIQLIQVQATGGAVTTLSPGPLQHDFTEHVFLPTGASLAFEVTADVPAALGVNQASEMILTSSTAIGLTGPRFDFNSANDRAVAVSIAQQGGHGTGILQDSGQRLQSAEVASAALGDIDGDGDLDALVVGRGFNRIWLNDGMGRFTNGGEPFDGGNTTDAALGDFDGDGDLDAFLTKQFGGQQLWLNDGDGDFTNAGLTLDSAYGFEASALDIDGDGDLDAVVNHWFGDSWRVWLNDGSGNLASGTYSLGPNSRGAVLGDLDGDGDADAFLAQDLSDRFVYFADAPGQALTRRVRYTEATDVSGPAVKPVALGDVDGDGDLDVISATDGTNRLWLNGGLANLTQGKTLGTGRSNGVALGDLNGDGLLDTVIAKFGAASTAIVSNSSGPLNVARPLSAADGAWDVQFGDLDGDGDLDAFIADETASQVWLNAEPTDLAVSISALPTAVRGGETLFTIRATNAGPNTSRAANVYSAPAAGLTNLRVVSVTTAGGAVSRVAPGSLAGAFSDIVDLPVGSEIVYVLAGRVSDSTPVLSGSDGTLTQIVSIHAEDAILETAFADNSAFVSQIIVAPATGGGAHFASSGESLSDAINTDVRLGDFDNDGDLDLVAVHRFDGIYIYRNTGNGQFGAPRQILGTWDAFGAAVADYDRDGDLDIFLATRNQPIVILRNDGAGMFQEAPSIAGSFRSHDIVLGDLDGDGYLDVLEVNRGQASRILLGRTRAFIPGAAVMLGPTSVAAALGDLDGDGDLDAFVANAYGEANQVWLNDGRAALVDSGQRLGASDSVGVALADVDGDGDLDALVANRGAHAELWLNNGLGEFDDSGQALSIDTGGIAVGDIDGDGDLDAVFAGTGGAANAIWRNDNGLFSRLQVDIGSSFGQAVALGDLNGNGALDLVFASNFEPTGRIWLNRDAAPAPPELPGDYNKDNIVDAADYVVWRMTQGTNVSAYSGADGSGDGVVDQDDFNVWRANFGNILPLGSGAVAASEPASASTAAVQHDGAMVTVDQADSSEVAAEPQSTGTAEPESAPVVAVVEQEASRATAPQVESAVTTEQRRGTSTIAKPSSSAMPFKQSDSYLVVDARANSNEPFFSREIARVRAVRTPERHLRPNALLATRLDAFADLKWRVAKDDNQYFGSHSTHESKNSLFDSIDQVFDEIGAEFVNFHASTGVRNTIQDFHGSADATRRARGLPIKSQAMP